MALAPEELHLTMQKILLESLKLLKSSPKIFSFITVTLIFPLSFAILAHSLFVDPILDKIVGSKSLSSFLHQLKLLLLYQFSYVVVLLPFSLLSTSAIVFTVASLYTAKPVSFSSTLFAIPRVFKRLFVTYLCALPLISVYNSIYFACIAQPAENTIQVVLIVILMLVVTILIQAPMTALWHLATIVSVMEPIYGFNAFRKSRELLRGTIWTVVLLVLIYSWFCMCTSLYFDVYVVYGGEFVYGVMTRVVVGGVLVGVMIVLNLIGQLVQSVIYYVCKSYHNEVIDRSVLYEHLGESLGVYVPLTSSIEMEMLDA